MSHFLTLSRKLYFLFYNIASSIKKRPTNLTTIQKIYVLGVGISTTFNIISKLFNEGSDDLLS